MENEGNPPPSDNQQQQPNYEVKFLCRYGGKIQPRPHDNQLSYVGGETKILSVDRNINLSSMIAKLSALCGDSDVSFKYQLPGKDLDALISVTNDDDLDHLMHEYDRLYRSTAKPARLRLFLFSASLSLQYQGMTTTNTNTSTNTNTNTTTTTNTNRNTTTNTNTNTTTTTNTKYIYIYIYK